MRDIWARKSAPVIAGESATVAQCSKLKQANQVNQEGKQVM